MEKIKFGKEFFIPNISHTMKDNYKIISLLGQGGNGQVYEVQNKKTKEIRACKYIPKNKINEMELTKFYR